MSVNLFKNICDKTVSWISKLIPVLDKIDTKSKDSEKKLKEVKREVEKLIKKIDKQLVKKAV